MLWKHVGERSGRFLRAVFFTCGVAAATVTAACNGNVPGPASPTPVAPSPLPPIANYGGAWHGDFTVTQCQGRRHCFASVGRPSPFVLRLEQSGAHVSGVFQAESFAIQVDGEVTIDGELSLQGIQSSPGIYAPTAELTRFTARQSATNGFVAELAYRLRYPDAMPATENSKEQTIAGTIPAAERGEVTPVNRFDGRWIGKLFISDCAIEGWTFCYPEERGHEYRYELTLSQTGDRVAGRLNFGGGFDVAGTVVGDTVTLEPTLREDPQSGGRYFAQLQRWTMTRDSVGQVRGEMAYQRDMVWDPSFQRPPYVSRYRAEIVYGLLNP
jgi:hypothetical protein